MSRPNADDKYGAASDSYQRYSIIVPTSLFAMLFSINPLTLFLWKSDVQYATKINAKCLMYVLSTYVNVINCTAKKQEVNTVKKNMHYHSH